MVYKMIIGFLAICFLLVVVGNVIEVVADVISTATDWSAS